MYITRQVNWSFGRVGSGFLNDKFFNLSLTGFGGRTGNQREFYFVGDYLFLGVVFIWAVDFVYVFPLIILLYLSLL